MRRLFWPQEQGAFRATTEALAPVFGSSGSPLASLAYNALSSVDTPTRLLTGFRQRL
jgi:hypothetical protein